MDNVIVIDDSSSDSEKINKTIVDKVIIIDDSESEGDNVESGGGIIKVLKKVENTTGKLILNIFDFDGTLFKSPEPNPSLWHPNMIGKLKAMASEPGGLGWFQDTLTLDHPYVPIAPSEDWFNTGVLAAVKESATADNTVTILLTGRTTLYADIIHRILGSRAIEMNHVGLKGTADKQSGGQVEPTFDFKISYIKSLLSQYNNRIKTINVYEDRIKHVEKFRKELAKIVDVTSNVIHVNEPPRYLEEHLEVELVQRLVAKNGTPSYRMRQIVSYTCALLDENSHHRIKSWFDFPADWEIKCHHATMNLGGHSPNLWKPQDDGKPVDGEAFAVGKKVQLKVEAVGISGAALALKVSGVPSNNNIIHVTLAHHPKGKPVDSNHIRQWIPIEEIGDLDHLLDFIAPPTSKKEETTTTNNNNNNHEAASNDKKKQPVKAPFEFPSISIRAKINKSQLVLDAVITEVGPTTYELVDGAGAKKKNEVNPSKGANLGELIKKHHPEAGQKIGKAVGIVKEWSTKNNITEIDQLEDYIKKLSLD